MLDFKTCTGQMLDGALHGVLDGEVLAHGGHLEGVQTLAVGVLLHVQRTSRNCWRRCC